MSIGIPCGRWYRTPDVDVLTLQADKQAQRDLGVKEGAKGSRGAGWRRVPAHQGAELLDTRRLVQSAYFQFNLHLETMQVLPRAI